MQYYTTPAAAVAASFSTASSSDANATPHIPCATTTIAANASACSVCKLKQNAISVLVGGIANFVLRVYLNKKFNERKGREPIPS
jgi:hypothetical protein